MVKNFFIYRSKIFEDFSSESDLQNIVEKARARNSAAGVTGFLHVQGLEVLQYLEGGSARLSEIKGSIFRDHRHGQIVLISEGEVLSARFPDWAMGLAAPEAVAPLRTPPFGLDGEDYIIFLEMAAARTRRNATRERLSQFNNDG